MAKQQRKTLETILVFKVSVLLLREIAMKKKILETARSQFIQFGFKSVTMDDIAGLLSISKKTIYEHFANKTALVKACVDFVFEEMSTAIQHIQDEAENPIEGLFEVKKIALKHMANSSRSPQFQLQKYYPDIYTQLKKKELKTMGKGFKKSLKKGIEMGLFRDSIDVDFITQIYFNGLSGLRNPELFPAKHYNPNHLLGNYLDYHLRAIATSRGVAVLEQYNAIKNT